MCANLIIWSELARVGFMMDKGSVLSAISILPIRIFRYQGKFRGGDGN